MRGLDTPLEIFAVIGRIEDVCTSNSEDPDV